MAKHSGARQFFYAFVCTAIAVFLIRRTEFIEHIAYRVEKGRLQALAERVPSEEMVTRLQTPNRNVAELITPAVVRIETERHVQVSRENADDLDFNQAHPFLRSGDQTYVVYPGLGSGFVVDAERGLILTNNHVTEEADVIQVILHDGRRFQAEVVGSDPQSDLAVVSVAADRLHEVRFGDSRQLAVGDDVFSLGTPFGLEGSFSRGIVSGLGRSRIMVGDLPYTGFIQTDAVINPGNSGGPLVNLRGEVIGVNTAIATESGTYSGVGFAIPSARVVQLLPQLIAGGTIVRGYLGVRIGDVRQSRDQALKMGWDEPDGVIVGGVEPDGPAAAAGLESGDIIVAVDGHDVADATTLMDTIAGIRPGRSVHIRFWRHDAFHTTEIKLARRPDGV